MLDPDRRSLLTALLTPPPGMVFDAGVATTYSLDPLTLLAVPVHLAWLGSGEDRALLTDGIRLLEAIQRVSDRLTVFADRGHMLVPGQAHALYGLLEAGIVEVQAPGGGAFHPKLWLLRFVRPGSEDEIVLRLSVLSRNLTADRSWDLSLQLDGRPTGKYIAANRELGEFLADLPGQALRDVHPNRAAIVAQLADELRRTAWEAPEPWEEVRFHVLGRSRRSWLPQHSNELAVISPFLKAEALAALCATTDTPLALISRPEELAALDPVTRARFSKCLVLEEAAETEDGEEADRRDTVGLHAKALLLRDGWYTHLYVGSANATNAALLHGNNLEVVAELVGKHSRVGRVEALLGEDDLGAMLVPFDPATPPETPDAERAAAEAALDEAQKALANAPLEARCARAGDDSWLLSLRNAPPIQGVAGTVWPLSLREDLGVRLGVDTDLGVVATADVTGLVGFSLSCGPVTRRFALNVPVHGLPADRDAAILRRIIRNREGFLRYLRLLLGGLPGVEAGGAGGGGTTFGGWQGGGTGVEALLEDLVRAFARDRDRLGDVRRLVDRLRAGDAGEEVIPPEFLAVWDVFTAAMEETR